VFTMISSHHLHRPGREQMIEQVLHVCELNEHTFVRRPTERPTAD
jgi:hypothetical protein